MRTLLSIFAATFVMLFCIGVQTAQAQEDVGRLLKQLEDDSDRFSNSVTKALDSSKWDGTSTEDQMIRFVREFEDSIDRIKEAHEKGQETAYLAKEVQTRAKAIDKFLKKNSLGPNVQTDWATVRAVLVRVANTHKIKPA